MMATASITRELALDLRSFCQKHNVTEVMFTKREGAFFSACVDSENDSDIDKHVCFLNGMNPNSVLDNMCFRDWHDTTEIKFGAANFHVTFPASWLDIFAELPNLSNKRMFSIRIQKSGVTLL
jgi:hypothetical protein